MRLTQPTKSTRAYLARQNALHKALKKFIREQRRALRAPRTATRTRPT